MKIGMLTTWGVQCGIAQHSSFLVEALTKAGHEVQVFHQKGGVTGTDGGIITRPCWEWYGRTNKVEFDEEALEMMKECDVLHIQYEAFLWHQDYLPKVMKAARGPVFMTHHSSCTGPGCPVSEVKANIVHDNDFPTMQNRVVMPMGIPEWDFVTFDQTRPTMGSFGLGRNDDEYCLEAMREASEMLADPIRYETHYGTSKWVGMLQLRDILQQHRILALIYPKVDAIVSSSAACVALATGLPVLCSNTRWFQHLRDYVHLVDSKSEMAHLIAHYMTNSHNIFDMAQQRAKEAVEKRGWSKIAKMHEELYNG